MLVSLGDKGYEKAVGSGETWLVTTDKPVRAPLVVGLIFWR